MMAAKRDETTATTGQVNAQDFRRMSEKEKLIATATANIQRFGDITPPPEILFTTIMKRCPHCKTEKLVIPGFGLSRQADGKVRANGWCTECRATPAARPGANGMPYKTATPRFPTSFIRAMDKHQRARYMQLYNELAEALGQPVRDITSGLKVG